MFLSDLGVEGEVPTLVEIKEALSKIPAVEKRPRP
jgi:hypothetical protein